MVSLAPARLSASRLSKSLLVPVLLVIFALAVVAAALAYVLGSPASSASQTVFQTVPVMRGTITNAIVANGEIAYPATVPVAFKHDGKVAAVSVKAGQRVEAGQELARLDTAELQRAVERAEAALEEATSAQERLANSPSESVASAPSATSASSPRAAVTAAQKDLETAKSSAAQSVRQAQAGVEGAQVKLDNAQRTLANAMAQASRRQTRMSWRSRTPSTCWRTLRISTNGPSRPVRLRSRSRNASMRMRSSTLR